MCVLFQGPQGTWPVGTGRSVDKVCEGSSDWPAAVPFPEMLCRRIKELLASGNHDLARPCARAQPLWIGAAGGRMQERDRRPSFEDLLNRFVADLYSTTIETARGNCPGARWTASPSRDTDTLSFDLSMSGRLENWEIGMTVFSHLNSKVALSTGPREG